VAVSGWQEGTEVDAIALARDVAARGAAGIIYTDIERDGTRAGVNVEATARLAAAVDVPVFASGGVGGAGDIRRLREAAGACSTAADAARGEARAGVGPGAAHAIAGVIVGRALYDGTVTLSELLAAARESERA
jgi:phosphoribosylformimino-5-aminoimidazole carboxamide ribotide isomerase